ncbi:hypothetical protein [Nocardioides sp. 503]|uniref:hypothetical protein n=1 Tax=Nocardioides sp. 503 TaxID=2508326 RepID=UPI0010703F08|nr:hypothetical protein [Nocardioides sp. 503]
MTRNTPYLSLGVAAAMSVGVLGFAIPALAAPGVARAESCANNRTCTYAGGTNHDGGAYNTLLTVRTPGTGLANMDPGLRNRLSSWKNTSGTGARFFYGLSGNGNCVSMFANDQASASASNPDDNQAESHSYTNRCT